LIGHTGHIRGIELLAAAQGIEFLIRCAAIFAELAHSTYWRMCATRANKTAPLAEDIERATALVTGGGLSRVFPHAVPTWFRSGPWLKETVGLGWPPRLPPANVNG